MGMDGRLRYELGRPLDREIDSWPSGEDGDGQVRHQNRLLTPPLDRDVLTHRHVNDLAALDSQWSNDFSDEEIEITRIGYAASDEEFIGGQSPPVLQVSCARQLQPRLFVLELPLRQVAGLPKNLALGGVTVSQGIEKLSLEELIRPVVHGGLSLDLSVLTSACVPVEHGGAGRAWAASPVKIECPDDLARGIALQRRVGQA